MTVTGHPVSQELWRRVGVSLRLVAIGSVLGAVIGVAAGRGERCASIASAIVSSPCCR
ncbi:oligopeptide ABC superfamily ATP binding cassette transporter, membrane domain protein [Mycobacterium xenopi 4042]|uniref:Oligopeptide ABC superfamily ATP binding cassette transporter, membrane domain protein n=1 Tax=Mycobacterium xenopi 4042 TaxID=1299334 RepID=X8DYK9_MYCXE|nr:oligopeptide ABC superfamily ATP binding cassette transporter, membrane domain protein [Mycobacterium xenopi 4042]